MALTRKKVLLIGAVIAGVIAIFALYPLVIRLLPPSTSDQSIIFAQPCRLPCWQNLTVGVSTRDDVNSVLDGSDFVPKWTIKEEQNTLRWFWSQQHRGRFEFNQRNVLIEAEIIPNFEFPIQTILELYGEPDGVSSRLDHSGDNSFNVRLSLYYYDLGLVVYFYSPVDPQYQMTLSPRTKGYGFGIHPRASSIEDFVSQVHNRMGTELDEFMHSELTLGWPGFGSIFTSNLNRSIFLDPLVLVTPTPD